MESAIKRYRIMAIIAGIVLLAFSVEIFVKYVFGPEIPWFAQLHGAVYMIYLVVTIDLSRRVNWKIGRIIGMCLAGTIPLLSFYAERWVVKNLKVD